MRNLLRSQRGSAAFATVIALVPLIGAVALGAEAGSWYVTRQQGQNAADAAAYAGALRLSCDIAGAANCPTTVDNQSRIFAAQNAFCNAGDSYAGCATSLPPQVARTVQVDIGNYSAGSFTTPAAGTGNAVRVRVSQQQPAYLVAVLGLGGPVNIPAQAIAMVQNPSKVCGLALGPDPNGGGALKIGGNVTNNGTGCPLMSDGSVQFASTPSFSGSGWGVYGATGCSPTNTCANPGVTHNYFMPYANNPLSKLDSESFNSLTATKPNDLPCNGTLTPNTPPSSSNMYRNLTCTNGKTVDFSPGTYFFYNATIRINGGTVTCSTCTAWPPAGSGLGVTLVLLGNSSISIAAGAVVNLSAPYTNTFSSDLNGVLIDDQAPSKTSNSVSVNGGTVKLAGAMYFPNVDVNWNGNAQSSNTTCSEVIAKTLTMGGGGYLSTDGCTPNTFTYTQIVALVQ